MVAVSLLSAGCATHYYRIKSDRVNLYLRLPEAQIVYFSSSLDGFGLYRTKNLESGIWEVAVPETREFTYFYKVDGVIFLPDCKLKEKDDFGDENCIFIPDL